MDRCRVGLDSIARNKIAYSHEMKNQESHDALIDAAMAVADGRETKASRKENEAMIPGGRKELLRRVCAVLSAEVKRLRKLSK